MAMLDDIMNVLQNLGGKAHYSEIYREYERITGESLTASQRASIRKVIEMYSSDSKNFRGRDIFYSVEGIGKGYWGLR